MIIKGKVKKPLAIMLYGQAGLGKTTFGEEAPSPIFISPEEIDEIDSARFPKLKSWTEFLQQLRAVPAEYKTLVIDGLDGIEKLGEKEILSKEPGKTMATACGGYGKAYERLEQMFMDVRDNYLVPLRTKGMNIVLICHASRTKFDNQVELIAYDRYEPNLHKKILPIFMDWVSACLFITTKVYKAEMSTGKESGTSAGERVIYTEERPGFIAKNRFELPYEIPFTKGTGWKQVAAGADKHFANPNGDLSVLLAELKVLINSLQDIDMKEKASKYVESNLTNATALETIKQRLITVSKGV
jgi:AAA domain